MLGPEHAARRVAEWLRTDIPRTLDRQRARHNLTPRDLPDPDAVLTHDESQRGIEHWPAIIAVPVRMTSLDYIDTTDAIETYRATYEITVYTWVRDHDYEQTARMRDRYALAIRETLLTRKQLTPVASTPGGWIKPETIVEDYSPVAEAGSRTIAGITTTFELTLIEPLSLRDPETAGDTTTPLDVRVDVERLAPPAPTGDAPTPMHVPPHPAYL